MTDFSKRSYQKELLDSSNIPFADISGNMKELDVINTRLGGHGITINGISSILKSRTHYSHNTPVSICEIGCGGGDNLAAICKWAVKNSLALQCYGIDYNEECIAYANSRNTGLPISFVHADYRDGLKAIPRPDIIFSSLFCHHFTDVEIIEMLIWMKRNAVLGFMINDLHRHTLAYHSIKFLTSLFSRSYLVKNDAPLSVLRGFKKEEWYQLFDKAGFKPTSVEWKWAYRYLITYIHK